jgi:hypothetical protein
MSDILKASIEAASKCLCCAEIERLRGELLLISQLQAGDGSTINGLTKDELGRAFRMAQDIARAALQPDQPSECIHDWYKKPGDANAWCRKCGAFPAPTSDNSSG